MDVLSNVLGVTQLANTVFCESELVSPWGMAIHNERKTTLHIVRRGTCWLKCDARAQPTRLIPGDVVLISQGVRHSLSDDLTTPLESWERVLADMATRRASENRDAAAESALLLCAAYEFEHAENHPLLSLLPLVIHLHMDESDANSAVPSLVRLLLGETARRGAGSEIVVPRLVDSLFVYILRAWLDSQPAGAAGWFGALRDPQVGRALALIHQSPHLPWTVASLARNVALSRAAFARRFCELVGEPPLRYLTHWRMNLAARILKTSTASMDAIATQVGYDSPTAFGKAFQRYQNQSPGRYRTLAHG